MLAICLGYFPIFLILLVAVNWQHFPWEPFALGLLGAVAIAIPVDKNLDEKYGTLEKRKKS